MNKSDAHILVIRLSAMGDVAMTVPVLRIFTQQFPTVKLTILTQKQFVSFFKNISNVSIVIADIRGKHKGVVGLWKLTKELKNLSFTAVADLHNVVRSKILTTFLNCTQTIQIDKGRTKKKQLVNGQIFCQLKPTYLRYVEVFSKLGFLMDLNESPFFPAKSNLTASIKSLFGNLFLKPIFGIAPFAAHQGKMYPIEQMKTVIRHFSKTHCVVLFGGGSREIEILSEIEKETENVVSVAGKLTLVDELALISNLQLMISMDSANAHMAAMLGIKVVTIWGVTHPFAGFYPYNQPKEYALLPDKNKFPKIPTSIYGNKVPKGYETVAASISPMTIIKKVTAILRATD